MAQREGQQTPQTGVKKDRQAVERLPDEISGETAEGTARPLQQDHNRDAARVTGIAAGVITTRAAVVTI